MRKRILAVLLAASSLSILLCGCQEKEIDYDMDTQEESTSSESSPLALETVDNWIEEFVVSEENSVSINANVTIPDVEQMSVTELQEVSFTEEYKKQVIQQLYGTLEVYSDEKEDWTKDRWQTLINITERIIKTEEANLSVSEQDEDKDEESINSTKDFIEDAKQEIEQYTAKMNEAPEKVDIVCDFSGDKYVGTYNNANYELEFNKNQYDTIVALDPEDVSAVCPEELKEFGRIWFNGQVIAANSGDNQCTISEEEAKKQAEAALRAIGWTECIWETTKQIEWGGYNGIEAADIVVDGYCFTCQKGAEGFAFGEFDTGYERLDEEEQISDGTATIYVNGNGIISLWVEQPVNFVQETENVSLLSLDTIKGIMRKELNENPDQYLSGKTTHFSEMELNYVRVKDGSREGYFSYVPAWRLCNKTGSGSDRLVAGCPVFVNAIDGSVIDLEDVIKIEGAEE